MQNVTLAIVKPDAAEHPSVEAQILRMALNDGFRIIALKRDHYAVDLWESFYSEHRGKSFFQDLTSFMTSGPVAVMVLDRPIIAGAVDAVTAWRRLIGATDPRKADPDTVRFIYGDKTGRAIWRNVAHGSATPADALREVRFFFQEYSFVRPGLVG